MFVAKRFNRCFYELKNLSLFNCATFSLFKCPYCNTSGKFISRSKRLDPIRLYSKYEFDKENMTKEEDFSIYKYVPEITGGLKTLIVLNIICPGLGTVIASLVDESCEGTVKGWRIGIGVAQFCLTLAAIGWFWSVTWCYFMYKKAQ